MQLYDPHDRPLPAPKPLGEPWYKRWRKQAVDIWRGIDTFYKGLAGTVGSFVLIAAAFNWLFARFEKKLEVAAAPSPPTQTTNQPPAPVGNQSAPIAATNSPPLKSWQEHYKVGIELALSNRLAEAREQFEQVVRLQPTYAPAHSSLGATLAQEQRFPEAIRELEIAVKLNPNETGAQALLEHAKIAATSPAYNQTPSPDYIPGTKVTQTRLKAIFPFGYVVFSNERDGTWRHDARASKKLRYAIDPAAVKIDPDFSARQVRVTIAINAKSGDGGSNLEIDSNVWSQPFPMKDDGQVYRMKMFSVPNEPELLFGTLSDNRSRQFSLSDMRLCRHRRTPRPPRL